MKRVILHIDRLVLKDFGDADRQRLSVAVQAQLAQVFGEPEVVRQLVATAGVPHLKLGQLPAATPGLRKGSLP